MGIHNQAQKYNNILGFLQKQTIHRDTIILHQENSLKKKSGSLRAPVYDICSPERVMNVPEWAPQFSLCLFCKKADYSAFPPPHISTETSVWALRGQWHRAERRNWAKLWGKGIKPSRKILQQSSTKIVRETWPRVGFTLQVFVVFLSFVCCCFHPDKVALLSFGSKSREVITSLYASFQMVHFILHLS